MAPRSTFAGIVDTAFNPIRQSARLNPDVATRLLDAIVQIVTHRAGAVKVGAQDDHRLAKRAKDMGSASVLVCLLNLVVVWSLVLLS